MANGGKRSGASLPKLAPLGDDTPYGVIWRINGALHLQGYASYDEAAAQYEAIIQRSKRDNTPARIGVYLVITLASYESD